MSQIDQAFIQAYADEVVTPSPAETLSLSEARQAAAHNAVAAPHVQLYSSAQNTQQVAQPASAAEPIPSPHFRGFRGSEPHADTAAMQRAMFEPAVEVPPSEPPMSALPALDSVGQRRPLSAFAEPAPTPSNVFEPVFEVDAFRWPVVTDELLSGHADLLVPVVEQLLAASEEGRTMIGIAGARPGVGCSTIQMCLARLLASTGKSVAIVDSNFVAANLAKNLGLEFDTGWEDVLTGKIPLAECVVRSIEDQMVLLPLAGCSEPPVELISSIQTSVIAGVLRYHYDLVLFDLGAAGRGSQSITAEQIVEQCRLDASIIVADTASQEGESDQEIDALMAVLGTTCLGVIGNFAVSQ